jgi:SAM-dependent methyltransferase
VRDIYETGYGNLFPDTNLLSIAIPAIRKFEFDGGTHESKFKVLDIGCGIGSNLLILNEFKNVSYQGIEISNYAVKIAKQRIEKMSLQDRAEIIFSPTEHFLSVHDQTWDLILDRASLQHHSALAQENGGALFLDLLSSRLAPNGLLVSLWAGRKNLDTNVRFENFLPFEDVRASLETILKLVSVKQISKIELSSDMNKLVTEEFLFVAKRRSDYHD